MKKLIFGLLTLITGNLYADSITNGSVGLIKISTGVVGTRNWGDKYNENFQIIANTMTTVQTNIANMSAAITSSNTAIYAAINSSNTAFQISNSTGQSYPLAANTTMFALSNSTTNLAALVAALSVSTTIIFNQESPDISNRTYYLHNETTGTASLFRLMSSSPSVDSEITRTQSLTSANNIVRISSHITPGNDPGVTKIPAGTWSFTSWVSASNITALTQLVITVSTCAIDGTAVTEVLSTTQTISDLNVDRLDSFVIQQNDIIISTSDRIVTQYFARTASVLSVNVSLYFAGTTHATHLTTPIGSVYKFTQLSDAPSTLLGQQGKYLSVNNDQTALVFISTPIGAASTGGSGQVTYSLVVGTPGTPNVDCIVSNLQQFNLALASLAACGLTTSATGYGTMLFRDGIYPILGATVPAGVYLYAGSSVVWQMTNGTNTLVTNYGRIDGFKFDLAGGIGCRLISLAVNSRLTNFLFYNSTGLAQGASNAYQYAILSVKKSSNIVIQGEWRDLQIPTGAANYGDNAAFKIEDSSSIDIRMNVTPNIVTGVASVFLYVARSNQINIHDGFYDAIGGNFIDFENGNSNITFARNKCVITKTAGTGDSGLIGFSGQTAANTFVSTGSMVVENNTFEIQSTDAGNIIGSNGNGGASAIVNGLVIKNNTVNVTSLPSATYKFALISTTVKGAVIQGNVTRGLLTFITDSGINTLYTSQGNTLYNVEQ